MSRSKACPTASATRSTALASAAGSFAHKTPTILDPIITGTMTTSRP